MNKSILTVALMVLTGMAFAQKDLIESKSLVGIWQQARVNQSPDGQTKIINVPVYKVLNADSSFVLFYISRDEFKTKISLWGSYKITSDSTFTESVTKQYDSPAMDNSVSQMRYKLLDENTLLMQYYNSVEKEWVPQVWVCVTPRTPVTNIN